MARRLREVTTMAEFFSAEGRRLMFRWASLWYLPIGDVECRHSRHRRLAKAGMSWRYDETTSWNAEWEAALAAMPESQEDERTGQRRRSASV